MSTRPVSGSTHHEMIAGVPGAHDHDGALGELTYVHAIRVAKLEGEAVERACGGDQVHVVG